MITFSGIVAHFLGLNRDIGGLKCILFHSHVCEIVQTGSVFSFSMPFKVMMIVRQFVFLGIYEF